MYAIRSYYGNLRNQKIFRSVSSYTSDTGLDTDTLDVLVSVEELALAAREGRLNVRADAEKPLGDYRNNFV